MKQKRLWAAVLLLAALLAACAQVPTVSLPVEEDGTEPAEGGEGLSILFLDVGQADSMLLRCGDDAMLVDGGNVGDSNTVAAVLGKQEGLDRLEYVVCTHAHEDHGGGIPGALHTLPADHLLAPVDTCDSRYFQNLLKAAAEQDLAIEIPAPGDTLSLIHI